MSDEGQENASLLGLPLRIVDVCCALSVLGHFTLSLLSEFLFVLYSRAEHE